MSPQHYFEKGVGFRFSLLHILTGLFSEGLPARYLEQGVRVYYGVVVVTSLPVSCQPDLHLKP